MPDGLSAMLNTIMSKLDTLTYTVNKQEEAWGALTPTLRKNSELLQEHSKLLISQSKRVASINMRIETIDNTWVSAENISQEVLSLKTELDKLKHQTRSDAQYASTTSLLSTDRRTLSPSFTPSFMPYTPAHKDSGDKHRSRNRVRTMRDDSRSVKLTSTTPCRMFQT